MSKICLVLATVAATASGQCDSGWSAFGQSCYILFPGAQSFDSHRVNCESLGGWLASIRSAGENTFVNQLQQAGCGTGACQAYIGLVWRAEQVPIWLDGRPFDFGDYSNWNPGDPNNFDGGDSCVEMIRDSGKWNDLSCSNSRPAICEKPQPATWCAAGWSPFGPCCYRLLTAIQSADLHVSDCQTAGGQLVSIRTAAGNNFVQQLQQSGCSGSSCPAAYIGLRRDSDGEFTSWVDDSPFGGSFYANWNTGEPNNGGESCAEMIHGTGKWNDISCNANRMAVCENCQPPTTTTSTTTTTTTTTTPTTTTSSTTTTTPTTTTTTPSSTTTATTSSTTTESTTTTTPTTTTPSTTIVPTTSTTTTAGGFDCRTVRTNVNCSSANGAAACDAQCRLFKYGRGICHSYGTTTCPGFPLGSKGCLCFDALDCRKLRTQVNCAAANAATSCTSWCKKFQWTQGACTTFQPSWTCPGYAAGQAACLCQ